jgi:hypothetical protein
MTASQIERAADQKLVDIRVSPPKGAGYAGEWIPLLLVVTRSSSSGTPVRLRHVTHNEKEIQVDMDLLDREVVIRPGENYRLTVPIRVSQPCVLPLATLGLQVQEIDSRESQAIGLPEAVSFPEQLLEIRPAIGQEIDLQLEPICAYTEGTKVQVTLNHRGMTAFHDWTVNFMPEQAVVAGKGTLQRSRFQPGDRDQVELVVNGTELELVMTASVDGQRTDYRKVLSIKKPHMPDERRFRFLEPRRLSTDQITVCEKESARPVTMIQGHFAVHGGEQYEVLIRPQQGHVSHIKIRDIQGKVHVRNAEEDRNSGGWRFLIDVAASSELFCRPEVLYYDMQGQGDRWTGEIPLSLQPASWRHLRVAAALGVAITIQGVAAAAKFLHKADYDLAEALTDFHWKEDFHLLFLFSIPLIWALFKGYDWVQFRLEN